MAFEKVTSVLKSAFGSSAPVVDKSLNPAKIMVDALDARSDEYEHVPMSNSALQRGRIDEAMARLTV